MRALRLLITFVSLQPSFPPQPAVQKPAFEAVSIKPGDAYDPRTAFRLQPGGRLSTTNAPLKMLIGFAYEANNQVEGGPEWLDTATFNIEAKAASDTPVPVGPEGAVEMKLMIQALLADRFRLAIHWETREEQVYELGIAKGGPKLKEADASVIPRMQVALGHFISTAEPISQLVRSLSQRLGRTVVDKTGLSGRYDFEFIYTPDPGQLPTQPLPPGAPQIDPNGPSLFAALEEQLGLKLKSTRGPVQVLIIDHLEKPSEN